MNKNSIMAVLLSTAVLIGYVFINQALINRNQGAALENNPIVEQEQTDASAEKDSTEANEIAAETSEIIEANTEETENLKEETYTIETNKYKVLFTNKGGDVVSFELKEHVDTKRTKQLGKEDEVLVQMAENVSEQNRAFSINLGSNSTKIVNDFFKVKVYPKENGQQKIAFARTYKDYTLVKQYTFNDDDYMFKLNVIIDGDENFKGLEFPSSEGEAKIAYTLRTSPAIGPYFDKTDRYESREFIAHNGSKIKKVRLTDNQYKRYNKPASWIGMGGKYFCELVVPETGVAIQDFYYSTRKENFDMANAQAYIERSAISSEDVNDVYYIYVGPRSESELKKFSDADENGWSFEGRRLNDALNSGSFLSWLEIAFKWVLQLINKVVNNWGISIILMTILLKLLLFPLTYKSSMGTLKMQEVQPRLQAIQAKYNDNPQKLQEETMKIYKETGYNPMSGCLPLILQMLALWAMFNLFNNYFEFRGASFIPGWIDDLSSGDSVWSWNRTIPIISGLTGNNIRILPIIYLLTQLFYGKVTQMGGTAVGQNQGTMKFMTYGLPIIFSVMFYNAPSGLLIFWTVSNLFQMAQQLIMNKVMAKKKAERATSNTSNLKHFPKKGKKK